jgi:hypothetical protein
LLLDRRASSTALNLGWRNRLSAGASLGLLLAAGARSPRVAAACTLVFLGANLDFYRLLYRKGGARGLAEGLPLHLLHQWIAVASLPLGARLHVLRRRRSAHEKRRGGLDTS